MAAKELPVEDLGLPEFSVGKAKSGAIFDLSSHKRAREALEFALSMSDPGFNVFVLGENQSGRLTSTVEFLKDAASSTKPSDDWVYLNDFDNQGRPLPLNLPAGTGWEFSRAMLRLLEAVQKSLKAAFGSEGFQRQMQSAGDVAQLDLNERMKTVQEAAKEHGLAIVQGEQGHAIFAIDDEGAPIPPEQMTEAQRETMAQQGPALAQQINAIGRSTAEMQASFQEHAGEMGRVLADQTCGPLIDHLIGEFSSHTLLNKWLVELRADVIENYRAFLFEGPDEQRPPGMDFETRYAVNLLVDNRESENAPVIVEPNPTYENLFGRVEYRQSMRSMETDHTLIRAGAMHQANGGTLVLRADAIASSGDIWDYLKAALRDREIHIQELYRQHAPTVAGALNPRPIPLNIKIVLIGAPNWYYTFFSADAEFQSYFKIKADIDPDMDADASNIATYVGLIREMASRGSDGGPLCADSAVARLLGEMSRRAAERTKLSSQFERVHDILTEARQIAVVDKSAEITASTIDRAIRNRVHRNGRFEDRIQEGIVKQSVLISTTGEVVGQINALTVRNIADHSFGTPSRVTASSSVGRRGVMNIERDVGLGGPIQQKGAMVLQGWLMGAFARRLPLSFNVSITFEQSYGGVDGDSASLAELVAILSDLSGIPVRQDLAITGSVNQRGQAQAIGGANEKIEGFFRTCTEAGALKGGQGVAVPFANEKNLTLRADIVDAVEAGTFAIYSLDTVEDAVSLFMCAEAGEADENGVYPTDSVFGRVATRLKEYDRILIEREGAF
jgi:predicted ATP-dependent protease